MNKAIGKLANDLLIQWQSQGIPNYITASEAYRLSGGKIGVPFSNKDRNKEMRLVDVAIKTIKKGSN